MRNPILAFFLLLAVAVCCFAALPASDAFSGSGALSGSWTVITGSPLQGSGVLSCNTAWGTCAARWTADTFTGDQYAEAVVLTVATDYTRVGVRVDASGNGYWVTVNSSVCSVIKGVANGGTFVKACGSIPASGSTVRIEASGSTLTIRSNGATLTTATDSTYSSGAAAIALLRGSANGNPTLDDFAADCIPTCGGGSPSGTRKRVIVVQ